MYLPAACIKFGLWKRSWARSEWFGQLGGFLTDTGCPIAANTSLLVLLVFRSGLIVLYNELTSCVYQRWAWDAVGGRSVAMFHA